MSPSSYIYPKAAEATKTKKKIAVQSVVRQITSLIGTSYDGTVLIS
jgi:hypothetical protein